ncbi:hypothetical protein M885DRAFT_528869 [Pelagophyceae sp. CCMP2097]|nr:hypothetical protein M885DRAFT_528869 [Pelagophyceae sp. CCMP2097]
MSPPASAAPLGSAEAVAAAISGGQINALATCILEHEASACARAAQFKYEASDAVDAAEVASSLRREGALALAGSDSRLYRKKFKVRGRGTTWHNGRLERDPDFFLEEPAFAGQVNFYFYDGPESSLDGLFQPLRAAEVSKCAFSSDDSSSWEPYREYARGCLTGAALDDFDAACRHVPLWMRLRHQRVASDPPAGKRRAAKSRAEVIAALALQDAARCEGAPGTFLQKVALTCQCLDDALGVAKAQRAWKKAVAVHLGSGTSGASPQSWTAGVVGG